MSSYRCPGNQTAHKIHLWGLYEGSVCSLCFARRPHLRLRPGSTIESELRRQHEQDPRSIDDEGFDDWQLKEVDH